MTLPGDVWRNLEDDHNGQCDCDDCDQPAVGRICIEADSFGAEWAHYCQAHLAEAEAKTEEPIIGDCDWCKAVDVEVLPTRDTDEGSHGPVYDVCKGCRQHQDKLDMEDLRRREEEQEEDFDPYEDERDCRVNPHDPHMDPDEDPEQAALNDLEFVLSQSDILTRQDIKTLLCGKATEAIRQIADNCTEGEYSRLFPRVV